MTRTLLLAIAISVSACAFGRQQAHDTARPRIEESTGGSTWVAIAVYDQRKEITSGDKEPDFVGVSRGGYGNPFDVTTKSEQPFASDVAKALATGLTTAGYRATVVSVAHTASPPEVMGKLTAVGANRLLLLRIDRWKSDTYMSTGLDFDVALQLMDAQGKLLGKVVEHGRDNVGGTGSSADTGAVQALETKLERLLNSPKIQPVLQSGTPADAKTPGRS